MKKLKSAINRITLSLAAALAFIFAGPQIPVVAENMSMAVVVLMAVLGLAALLKRAWEDVIIAAIIGLTFALARLYFDQVDELTYTFRVAATLAFVFLNFTLFIGPWARFTKLFRRWYKFRRHFGVTTFLLAYTHASLILELYFQNSLALSFSAAFVFFGHTALFMMAWLAITSWDKVQKKVTPTWWNIVHGVLFLVYAADVYYMTTVVLDIETWHYFFLGAFLLFWLLASPWSLPRVLVKRVSGWKQLHMMVYVAYTAMIIHVWTGVVSLLDAWIQAGFWTLVVVVVSSHALGWIIMGRKAMAKRAKAMGASQAMERDEGTFVAVAKVSELTDGKGIAVSVEDEPRALFKNGDEYFAIPARCPHQGGPLAEGEIVNGYVECPWHKWQFAAKDGGGPPGFPDCVPYYPAFVEGDTVYVAVESTGKCEEKNGHMKMVG